MKATTGHRVSMAETFEETLGLRPPLSVDSGRPRREPKKTVIDLINSDDETPLQSASTSRSKKRDFIGSFANAKLLSQERTAIDLTNSDDEGSPRSISTSRRPAAARNETSPAPAAARNETSSALSQPENRRTTVIDLTNSDDAVPP